jgi:hypothetical protein
VNIKDRPIKVGGCEPASFDVEALLPNVEGVSNQEMASTQVPTLRDYILPIHPERLTIEHGL